MPKEPEDVVVEDDQKPEETVEIPTKSEESKPSEAEKVAAKVREDFDKLYGGRLESLESRLRQSLKQNDQLRTELSKLATPTKPETSSPAPVKMEKDELDALVEQGRWKEAVAKLAAQQAQDLLQQQKQLDQQQMELTARQTYFEQSKQAVVSRYPDLDPETGDEESFISMEFNKMLNEHPYLLKEPLGPTEAMRLTEERLQSQGVDLSQFRAKAEALPDNKELIRRQQANLSGLPPSRPGGKPGSIVLTKSEKEFIDYWGIAPSEYVKNKEIVNQGGAIEA